MIVAGALFVFFSSKTTAVSSIQKSASLPLVAPSAPLKVGAVTWHTKNFVNKEVKIVGFVLKKEKGYIIFSDEATGLITKGDLPVTGAGVDTMVLKHKYILQGKFLYGGLKASNGNLYHLELSGLPTLVN